MRDGRRVLPPAIVAAVGIVALVGAGTGGSEKTPLRAASSAWQGLVGGQRPPVSVGQRMLVVLRSPSLADRVTRAGGLATDRQERRWTAAAFAAQKQLISELGSRGIPLQIEFSYARVLNGFSAALDARGVALLERSKDVVGVYPVRAAYPASISSTLLEQIGIAPGSAQLPDISLPGFDGRGVTIALLDTGVDRAQPYLRGRVLAGIDVVGGSAGAAPAASPVDATLLESHGTEMAGLLTAVAAKASVLPIRVAGWQSDARGQPAVYARTDQLLAGLERAVDPNDDGDAHDAARITLVALAEPYAAFGDSPLARGAAGALSLDTLVVAAAGNDGPAGPLYGSASGPGAAAGALGVGAADRRGNTESARVVLRTGLETVFNRAVPLAGAVVPSGRVEGELAAPPSLQQGAPAPTDFFDDRGFSLVAGRIALLPAGVDPRAAATGASAAGATAVVLYGHGVPPGGIGLDEGVGIPVVAVPSSAGMTARASLWRGRSVAVSIGAPRVTSNGAAGRVPSFSSRGLAFDGRLKPDLVGPGVALLTSEPGSNEDGTARFGSVSGTSAAAATVAGAAAILAQARPSLDARALRSVLVGTARAIAGEPATAQGTGLVDLGAAAGAEFASVRPSIPLGRVTEPGTRLRKTLTLRSLSPRTLRLFVGSELSGPAAGLVSLRIQPRRLTLRAGKTARTTLAVQIRRVPRDKAPLIGTIDVTARGSQTMRVPLTLTFGRRSASLIGDARLSRLIFQPSDAQPTVLAVRVGGVVRSAAGDQLEPVARLDLELRKPSGKLIGLLARLRDLKPGRYVFGLTGRGPAGKRLRPGAYHLRLVAIPTDGGPPSLKRVGFRIG